MSMKDKVLYVVLCLVSGGNFGMAIVLLSGDHLFGLVNTGAGIWLGYAALTYKKRHGLE